jgi:uncharacterized protein
MGLSGMDRRKFIGTAGALGAGMVLAGTRALGVAGEGTTVTEEQAADAAVQGPQLIESPGGMPRRKFGKDGPEVSILCLGGYHIGSVKDDNEAIRIMHAALEGGMNFFDNCWEYNDHRSEELMGRAIADRRDKVFLMTKVCTHGRDKKVAMQQLEESLKRLKTDHVDLWQIHEVVYYNEPEMHFRPGGAVEALEEAKKQGKARFIGFTGHKDPSIHLAMLSHGFPFDAVQMPTNCFDATFKSFESEVLPKVVGAGMAAIGMKSMGGDGKPVKDGVLTAQEARQYAMSLPLTTLVVGIDSMDVLQQDLRLARDFKPLGREALAALREKAAAHAGDGSYELFKTSMKYDGAEGREQHGFPPHRQMQL